MAESDPKKHDGGPAFPTESDVVIGRDGMMIELSEYGREPGKGMSLRDYFAAKAMQALVGRDFQSYNVQREDIAVEAYRQADAMLKCRSHVQESGS